MKKRSKIAILVLIGIVALAFVNAGAAADEKVTFDGVKLTQPSGITHTTDPNCMDFYNGKQLVFSISNDGVPLKEFDDTYSALSSGKLSYDKYMSSMTEKSNYSTTTNCSLETIEGYKTITTLSKDNTNSNIYVVKMIRTPDKVYTVSYLENDDNGVKIYDSMQFK